MSIWVTYSWGQSKFSDALQFNTSFTGDFVINFSGGLKRGYTYIGKEDLTVAFNTEQAGLWRNGNLFLHGLNTHGNGPSATLTGDLQMMSNIEAGDHTSLYEYWYCQQIGKVSILVGQHDLNSEFVGTKYGGTFINSSFGIAPSISLNVPVSIYPLAAPCLFLKYKPGERVTYKAAVYDGNPGNFATNRYNLEWNINKEEGLLYIAEVEQDVQLNGQQTGSIKIGTFYHSGHFINYTDTLKLRKGNYGAYIVAEKALFACSLHAGRGLCIFFQGGITPSVWNMVRYYVGGGFRYHGILPARFKDELGIAFAHISLSEEYIRNNSGTLSYETALEGTYIFRFGGRYSIQPNLQYIIHPGANKNINNCLAGLLRFSLTYP